MKGILKTLGLIICLGMIGIGGYFMFLYDTPTDLGVVQEEAVYYEGIRLINTTEAEARAIIDAFNSSLAYDSFWWLPSSGFESINDLDNNYRLAIASYQLWNNPDEYESTERDDVEVFEPSEMLAAWQDVVGDIPLTDGTPCEGIDLCNELFIFNAENRDYEVTDAENERMLSIVKLTEIRRVNDEFALTVNALYVSKLDDGSYEVYTTPTEERAIGNIEAMEGDNNERAYLLRAGEDLLEESLTYHFFYRFEDRNIFFSGFGIR